MLTNCKHYSEAFRRRLKGPPTSTDKATKGPSELFCHVHGLGHTLFFLYLFISSKLPSIPLTTVVIQNYVMSIKFLCSSRYDINFEFRALLNTKMRSSYCIEKIQTLSTWSNQLTFFLKSVFFKISKIRKMSCSVSLNEVMILQPTCISIAITVQ